MSPAVEPVQLGINELLSGHRYPLADLNGDCGVDVEDIVVVARWSRRLGSSDFDPLYDLDQDGDIDMERLLIRCQ
ncbi:MAG TPA: hypothetical protein EYP04_03095 [Anaerolineae bacterium]|nr:hypothetical protein [Anaerolineae bacterium]HIQ06022.1 hypothetical protein [Anaerolineae bacterium]